MCWYQSKNMKKDIKLINSVIFKSHIFLIVQFLQWYKNAKNQTLGLKFVKTDKTF